MSSPLSAMAMARPTVAELDWTMTVMMKPTSIVPITFQKGIMLESLFGVQSNIWK